MKVFHSSSEAGRSALGAVRRRAAWGMLWAITAGLAAGQSGLDRPVMSWMLDALGNVRPVYGVAGATTLGDPVVTGAVSIACGAQLCLAKTDASVISFSGSSSEAIADAPAGRAVFAIDGSGAWIYFPETSQLARWQNGQLNPFDFTPDGEVLSIRAAGDGVDLAVRHADGVWIEHWSGADGSVSLIDSLPRSSGAVMLLNEAVIFATPRRVILRRDDGTVTEFDAAGVNRFYIVSGEYVQARAGTDTQAIQWAIRTTLDRERMFLLPGVAP